MKVFYELFISFSLLVFSITSYGQSKDEIIKDIRSSFQQINNDKSLKIIKLKNDEFQRQTTDGGESLTGYFKGDTICKMIVSIGLSFGERQFEYYLENGQLFFIYEKEADFSADNSGTLNFKKLDLAFEGRYYINEGKVIEVKIKGQKRFDEKPIIDSLNNVLWDVKFYKKILKSHLERPRN